MEDDFKELFIRLAGIYELSPETAAILLERIICCLQEQGEENKTDSREVNDQ